ncbi:hypothetical protein Cma02nite_22500 [Cellulomonas marina]|nr:hypothetical protein Cma02nite_22500 [Cellulomonas marina]
MARESLRRATLRSWPKVRDMGPPPPGMWGIDTDASSLVRASGGGRRRIGEPGRC